MVHVGLELLKCAEFLFGVKNSARNKKIRHTNPHTCAIKPHTKPKIPKYRNTTLLPNSIKIITNLFNYIHISKSHKNSPQIKNIGTIFATYLSIHHYIYFNCFNQFLCLCSQSVLFLTERGGW